MDLSLSCFLLQSRLILWVLPECHTLFSCLLMSGWGQHKHTQEAQSPQFRSDGLHSCNSPSPSPLMSCHLCAGWSFVECIETITKMRFIYKTLFMTLGSNTEKPTQRSRGHIQLLQTLTRPLCHLQVRSPERCVLDDAVSAITSYWSRRANLVKGRG